MAATTDKLHLDSIKSLFECAICSGSFKGPTQVKCGSIFCKLCIDQFQKENDDDYCCPLCKESLQSRGRGLTKSREDVHQLSEAFNFLFAAYQSEKQSIDTIVSEGMTIQDDATSKVQINPESSTKKHANSRPEVNALVFTKSTEQVEEPKKLDSPLSPPQDDIDALNIFNNDTSKALVPFRNEVASNRVVANFEPTLESPLDLSVTLSNSQIARRDSMRQPKVAFQCVSPSTALDLSSSSKRKLDESEKMDPNVVPSTLYSRLNPKLKICVRKSLDKEFLKYEDKILPTFSSHPYIPKINMNCQIHTTKMLEPLQTTTTMSPPSNFKRIKISSNNNKMTAVANIDETIIGGNMSGDQILEKEEVENPPLRLKPLSFDGNLDEMTDRTDKIISELDLDSVICPTTNEIKKVAISIVSDLKTTTEAAASFINEKEDENDVESDSSSDSFLCSTPKREAKSFSMNKSKVAERKSVAADKEKVFTPVRRTPSAGATKHETPNIIYGTGSTAASCFSPPSAMIQKDNAPPNVTADNFPIPIEDGEDTFGDDMMFSEDFDDEMAGLFVMKANEMAKNDAVGTTEPLQPHIDTTRNDGQDMETRSNNNIMKLQTAKQRVPRPSSSVSSDECTNQTRPKKLVFCPTRLNRLQLSKLHQLCETYGGTVSKDYGEDVTHLILTLENNRVPQTMKYLFSIAGKKWIVVFDWVEECLKQSKLISEMTFETSNLNFPQCDEGVRKSRLSKTLLFEGKLFHVSGSLKSSGATVEEWQNLLKKLGGKVIDDVNMVHKEVLIVGDSLDRQDHYQNLFKAHEAITVAWEWILDCIISYSLLPLTKSHYLITKLDGTERLAHTVLTPELFGASAS